MDEICEALATKIYTSSRGGYAIFYEDELFDEMPKSEDKNRETLEAALKKLSSGGFIEIKYARGNAFCMAGIKPYEKPVLTPITQIVKGYDGVNHKRVLLYSSFGALIGGILGGVISVVVAVILL
jgi:hypothetical protein